MIITRRIQVLVDESDADLRKEYYNTICNWSEQLRKAANILSSHKFVQMQVSSFLYLKEDVLKKVYTKDILKEEPGNSEQNCTYRVLSSFLKGSGIPSDIIGNLNQAQCKTFKENYKEYLMGEKSIPSYRSMPIPFSAKVFSSLKAEERTDSAGNVRSDITMRLPGGIPLVLHFGRDLSGNRTIIERAMSGEGGYKFHASSLEISRKKDHTTGKKMLKLFLLACIDIPKKEVKLDDKKVLYARLSVFQPLLCSTDAKTLDDPDAGNPQAETDGKRGKHAVMPIGTSEEFLHRRLQIQLALQRMQAAARYANGGHGRKKKMAAIDRFKKKEKNYVGQKTHLYSSMLVKEAVRRGCGTLWLLGTEECEGLKGSENVTDKLVLRNWSYFNLSQKINYKAAKYGIRVVSPKTSKKDQEDIGEPAEENR